MSISAVGSQSGPSAATTSKLWADHRSAMEASSQAAAAGREVARDKSQVQAEWRAQQVLLTQGRPGGFDQYA